MLSSMTIVVSNSSTTCEHNGTLASNLRSDAIDFFASATGSQNSPDRFLVELSLDLLFRRSGIEFAIIDLTERS